MKQFHYSYRGDDVYRFTIDTEQYDDYPHWEEPDAFPPLSPRVAITEAGSLLRSLFPDIHDNDIRFSACALKRLGPRFWFYLVTFTIPAEEPEYDDHSFDIPVLFNAVVLSPERFPDVGG